MNSIRVSYVNTKVGNVSQEFRPRTESKGMKNTLTLIAILLFAFLAIAPTCSAQTQFPDTPAGQQAKAWLDAFNAADAEKYKEFVRKNFPAREQNAERDMEFRAMTGGFELN